MELIKISICLSDIPREFIKEGKNGKLYLDAYVNRRREPDFNGNNLAIVVAQPAGSKPVYIGNGKSQEINK